MNEFKPIIKVDEEWITEHLKNVFSVIPRVFNPREIEQWQKNLWEYYMLKLITAETRDYYYTILEKNLVKIVRIATEKEIEEIKKEEVKDDE
jgi:hypothetical protein